MDVAIILTIIGTAWTIIWAIFTWYVPHKAKRNIGSVLACREEVLEWQFKQEEERLRRAILTKGFSSITTFVIFIVPYIILAISGGSREHSSSQAGTSTTGDVSDKFKNKIENFYDKFLPKSPDKTINIIIGFLILFGLPFLLEYIEVGTRFKIILAGLGGGACITAIARIISKLYFLALHSRN